MNEFAPILFSVENKNEFLFGYFARLQQSDDFKEFVEGPVSSWEGDDGLGLVSEAEFPHEKIMEDEREVGRYIRIGILGLRKGNIHSDSLSSGPGGAAIGGLHDSGARPRRDDKILPLRLFNRDRPFGQKIGQFFGFPIIAVKRRVGVGGIRLGRTEEEDGAVDFGLFEASHRTQIFAQNPQRPTFQRLEKFGISEGNFRMLVSSCHKGFPIIDTILRILSKQGPRLKE